MGALISCDVNPVSIKKKKYELTGAGIYLKQENRHTFIKILNLVHIFY